MITLDFCQKIFCFCLKAFFFQATGDGCVLLRTALLYSKFNMNDKFSWELLFDSWNDVSETVSVKLESKVSKGFVLKFITMYEAVNLFYPK